VKAGQITKSAVLKLALLANIHTYPLFQATKPIEKKEKRQTEKKQNTCTVENKINFF